MLDSVPSYRVYLIAATLHTTLLVICFSLLKYIGLTDSSIFDIGYQWDSDWYWSIVLEGYSYVPNSQSNVAYYPLFAWLWELSNLGPLGVSILNWLITLISVYIISREFNIPLGQLILFSSFPSAIFFMVPYSEALFLLGGAFILAGLNKDHLALILIGVVLACTTRSIGFILSLCFLFTYLIKVNWSFTRKDHVYSLLPIAVALIVNWAVQLYQFDQSGVHFNYLEVQAQWERVLDFPSLPLTARPIPSSAWADYLALFVGILSGVILVRSFFEKKTGPEYLIEKPAMFSLFYLAGITCVVLLFSGKYVAGSTVIASLNRYVFATPYFLLFIQEMTSQATRADRKKSFFFILSLSILEWGLLTFGLNRVVSQLNWQVYFLIVLTLPFIYFHALVKHTRLKWWIPLYLISTLLQAYFLGLFIAERWVG